MAKTLPSQRVRAEPDREPKTQYAALPWRRGEGGEIEILLITSRETRRWVIPKGWPIKGLKPSASAAQEAFEEAGLRGTVSRKSIGAYQYYKRLRSGRTQHVRVFVHALEVHIEAEDWPEKGQRDHKWAIPSEAAELVDEPQLKKLLTAFNA